MNNSQHCRKHRHAVVELVPFDEVIGVGWFRCSCGNLFAGELMRLFVNLALDQVGFLKGWIRGDCTSPCYKCSDDVSPMFIVPGVPSEKEKKEKGHNCSLCNGDHRCPLLIGRR